MQRALGEIEAAARARPGPADGADSGSRQKRGRRWEKILMCSCQYGGVYHQVDQHGS